VNKTGLEVPCLVTQNDRDCITELTKKRVNIEAAKGFEKLLGSLSRHDFDWGWAYATHKARILDGNIGLLELKNFGATWRIACYLSERGRNKFVLLESFKSHQGTDHIPPDIMDRLRTKARAVKVLDDNGEILWK
jgi:hypothetical protein